MAHLTSDEPRRPFGASINESDIDDPCELYEDGDRWTVERTPKRARVLVTSMTIVFSLQILCMVAIVFSAGAYMRLSSLQVTFGGLMLLLAVWLTAWNGFFLWLLRRRAARYWKSYNRLQNSLPKSEFAEIAPPVLMDQSTLACVLVLVVTGGVFSFLPAIWLVGNVVWMIAQL